MSAPHLTPAEWTRAEKVLRGAPFAYIAMVEHITPQVGDAATGTASPYVVPMNFAYEPASTPQAAPDGAPPASLGRLFFHTGAGRKTETLAEDPRVCVAVTAEVSFDQGATPCQDGFAFRSVLLEGRVTLLEDPGQREKALRAIVAKYDADAAGLPFTEPDLARTMVYLITIETLTYRERPRRRRPVSARSASTKGE